MGRDKGLTHDGTKLLEAWKRSGLGKREYWRKHLRGSGLTYDAFHGRCWRAEKGRAANRALFTVDLGQPWRLEGDYMIIGDVQLPTTNIDFIGTMLAVAERHMSKPRRLIIAGDFINADAFSTYESDVATPAFESELAAAEELINEFLTVFSEIYWFWGNHERRIGKRTKGALTPAHMRTLVSGMNRELVHVSQWGHATVTSGGIEWRVTHARNYSVQQINVADWLALRYQTNIIQHHEHHLATGWDRFKRYVVINNGGMFDPDMMAYAMLDDSKSPCMMRGFTMLQDGYPHTFSAEPYTNYDMWLGSGRGSVVSVGASQ